MDAQDAVFVSFSKQKLYFHLKKKFHTFVHTQLSFVIIAYHFIHSLLLLVCPTQYFCYMSVCVFLWFRMKKTKKYFIFIYICTKWFENWWSQLWKHRQIHASPDTEVCEVWLLLLLKKLQLKYFSLKQFKDYDEYSNLVLWTIWINLLINKKEPASSTYIMFVCHCVRHFYLKKKTITPTYRQLWVCWWQKLDNPCKVESIFGKLQTISGI